MIIKKIKFLILKDIIEGINAQQCSDTDYVRAIYEASDLVWDRYDHVYDDVFDNINDDVYDDAYADVFDGGYDDVYDNGHDPGYDDVYEDQMILRVYVRIRMMMMMVMMMMIMIVLGNVRPGCGTTGFLHSVLLERGMPSSHPPHHHDHHDHDIHHDHHDDAG